MRRFVNAAFVSLDGVTQAVRPGRSARGVQTGSFALDTPADAELDHQELSPECP